MTSTVAAVGAVTAITLIALLIVTLRLPSLRFWPTPGPGTWQSYLFWPLFRGLNILCFAIAILDHGSANLLPIWLRILALGLLAASMAIFVYAFRLLGRDNSYGAQEGLVTSGIYQWTRNPQNAMLVVVYACLAIAADSTLAYLLCAAMMTVYTLMILAEEPWLAGVYGDNYRRYCAEVPRFFNWKRALQILTTRG